MIGATKGDARSLDSSSPASHVFISHPKPKTLNLPGLPLQAMGVMSAIGAMGRMAAPQLFTRLWLAGA